MDLDAMLEISNQCIHSEPPVCVASCPVHMDILGLVSAIEQKDFAKAYKVMESKVPFARLVGKICDHPCEKSCVRQSIGGSIRINELEKLVVALGYVPPKKAFPLPKNKGKVAIIGGGLSGCVAALELDKKGYAVTIFEKSTRLGGSLWGYEGKGLEKEILEEELSIILQKGIKVQYQTEVLSTDLEEYFKTYDAIYLGSAKWNQELNVDSQTFQVEKSPLFVGGKLQVKNSSIIHSLSSGKRAAVSIDRFISKTSMLASREREGVFQTKLDFKIDKVATLQSVEKSATVYSEDEACLEASRCLKC